MLPRPREHLRVAPGDLARGAGGGQGTQLEAPLRWEVSRWG